VERIAVDSYVLDALMPDLIGHDRKHVPHPDSG